MENSFKGSTILTQNSKIKKTSKKHGIRLFNFGIPAYKTNAGKTTCPFAKDCVAYCYAQKGAYKWKQVNQAFEKRYELTQRDDFAEMMNSAVRKVKASHIRIHDSGDFYSKKYLNKWIKVANDNKTVEFYFYTKSIKMIKETKLPKNMHPIFSLGSKQDNLIDLKKDRHAKIFNSLEELKRAKYTDCSQYDTNAIKTNKVGLVAH